VNCGRHRFAFNLDNQPWHTIDQPFAPTWSDEFIIPFDRPDESRPAISQTEQFDDFHFE